jgi:PAS domain S-box-containing protein
MLMELLSVVLSGAMAHAAEFEAKRDQVQALARFEATFANALTGMVLLDLHGRILESNPAIQKLLGYTHEELAGKRLRASCPRPTAARRARRTSG